jgi:hypothetical protein
MHLLPVEMLLTEQAKIRVNPNQVTECIYIPSNLSYWRDVITSFVIPRLVRPNFLVFAISSVLESLRKDFDRHL